MWRWCGFSCICGKRDTPFAVLDSHAGRGLYDLSADEAQRTGEAQGGIARLGGLKGPETLDRYLALVEESGKEMYPGSPLIAAKMLRPQDRLVAIEKHPEEAAILKQVLAPFRKARAEEGDGYVRLQALLPPPERRGLVLLDPPFEAPDEFQVATATVKAAVRRFATGILSDLVSREVSAAARAFCGEVLAGGAAKALNIVAAVDAGEGKLGRAGLLVLNPPFGFDTGMEEILAVVMPRLPGGKAALERLTG